MQSVSVQLYVCATVQACRGELCTSLVNVDECDLVFPAVIGAFSVSHLIAECRSGERAAPARDSARGGTGRTNEQREAAKEKMTELEVVICEASLRLQLRLKHSFCPRVQTGKEKQVELKFHP